MQEVSPKKQVEREEDALLQREFLPVEYADLQVIRSGEKVGVFCRGFCFCTYDMTDRFSRNYCIVQLHLSGHVKLRRLAKLFGLGYQHCSNVLSRYKRGGIDGLVERTERRYSNRRVIGEEIGEFILGMRRGGQSCQEISEGIRFRFKKKVEPQSIRAWIYREKQRLNRTGTREVQPGLFGEEQQGAIEDGSEWHWNKYAGSMLLYGAIEWSGFLRPFEEYIFEDERRKRSSWGVRRVLLTLFFMQALRFKSIEQSKHVVGEDFSELVGGDFLRLQWLRYGVDGIVQEGGFNRAIEGYFKSLINLVDRGDGIFYTDGHFSSYYGKRKVPKGYDPRRQMGFRGRNTIFLHNSQGEVLYLFESPVNTSLSNDIEKLTADVEVLGMEWKGKTLIFDRGGYSQKCFRYLKEKREMYFVTYLKNRRKEREIAEREFKTYRVKTEDGEEGEYQICEKEKRETRYGSVRVVVLLAEDGRQIPVLTNNPHMQMEEIVYLLQHRWREENCFKYLIEHFGIDLLTTYKTEEAPDKVIRRSNPDRQKINQKIKQKKSEREKLQSELAQRVLEKGKGSKETIEDFLEQESDLKWAIKNIEVDLDSLKRKRESIPTKIEINLKDDHVVIAQKRRLLINSVKAMNYNAEKWFQSQFKKVHRKTDETLSLVRSLWQQPGQIRRHSHLLEVKLRPLDSGSMQESLERILEKLKENNQLRLPDGRIIKLT